MCDEPFYKEENLAKYHQFVTLCQLHFSPIQIFLVYPNIGKLELHEIPSICCIMLFPFQPVLIFLILSIIFFLINENHQSVALCQFHLILVRHLGIIFFLKNLMNYQMVFFRAHHSNQFD